MGFVREYATQAPERSEVDRQAGLQVLEFGIDWCGHCIAAQPLLQKLLGGYEAIDYRKIEDGKGRPLGRSFWCQVVAHDHPAARWRRTGTCRAAADA